MCNSARLPHAAAEWLCDFTSDTLIPLLVLMLSSNYLSLSPFFFFFTHFLEESMEEGQEQFLFSSVLMKGKIYHFFNLFCLLLLQMYVIHVQGRNICF